MRLGLAVAFALLVARAAGAHSVPIPPSTCAFDPLLLGAATTVIPVDPPDPTDVVSVTYDTAAFTATFQSAAPLPRAFVADGVAGTLTAPTLFVAQFLKTGDLTAENARFVLTLGAARAVVPITLTTGFAIAGDTVLQGTPIDANGTFVAVGAVADAGLGGPFAGVPLTIRLRCQLAPPPDRDQFLTPATPRLVEGSAKSGKLAARIAFSVEPNEQTDFAGRPAFVLATVDGTTIALGVLGDGLPKRGRKLWIGRSADRRVQVGVRFVRRRKQVATYVMEFKLKDAVLPSIAARSVPVRFAYDVGGLLVRFEQNLHANGKGTKLAFP